MKGKIAFTIIFSLLLLGAAYYYTSQPASPPSPTVTPVLSPSPTPSSTPTSTPSPTPTSTPSPTPSPSPILQKPIAKISAETTTIRLGESITLSAGGSTDPDGEIVEYKWILSGVYVLGRGEKLTYNFSDAGNYTITLQVKDDDGLTNSTEIYISVVLEKYALLEAIEAGYVEANITGRTYLLSGVSSGDSIVLRIQRLVNYTIEIESIPTGTLLIASGDAQNMAVLRLKGKLSKGEFFYEPSDRIILDTSDVLKFLFSAYCVDFDKPNPTKETTFHPEGLADDVLKVFEVLDDLPENVTTIAAIQTAIFVITDDVSLGELEDRFPSGVEEIENARTILEAAGIDISTKRLFIS